MIKNERVEVITLLSAVINEGLSLTSLLQEKTAYTPLVKALCFGVCRYYYQLQVIALQLMAKRPDVTEIWLLILIGLYQLNYSTKPAYAIINESVNVLDLLKKSWAKGLVNAVLRRFTREQILIGTVLAQNNDYCFAHPAWLVDRIQQDWPEHWQAILLANNNHPPMTLRVNRNYHTLTTYLDCLTSQGMAAHPLPYSSVAIGLGLPCDVKTLPGFHDGHVSVQDEAAQLAVSLLNLKPGLRVLDACCAPGGKTCHILETEPNLGCCVALDIDKRRLKQVEANLNRLNLKAEIKHGNAATPHVWWDGQLFDRILLDAPCSATGVIRRHPDIKLLRQPQDMIALVILQQQLLQQLWPLLVSGGLLVYATCSIMAEENAEQIALFLSQHRDATCIDGHKPWAGNYHHGWQIRPGLNNLDGFFYSVLAKI